MSKVNNNNNGVGHKDNTGIDEIQEKDRINTAVSKSLQKRQGSKTSANTRRNEILTI